MQEVSSGIENKWEKSWYSAPVALKLAPVPLQERQKAEKKAELEIRDSEDDSEGEEQVIIDHMINKARLKQLLKNTFTHAKEKRGINQQSAGFRRKSWTQLTTHSILRKIYPTANTDGYI